MYQQAFGPYLTELGRQHSGCVSGCVSRTRARNGSYHDCISVVHQRVVYLRTGSHINMYLMHIRCMHHGVYQTCIGTIWTCRIREYQTRIRRHLERLSIALYRVCIVCAPIVIRIIINIVIVSSVYHDFVSRICIVFRISMYHSYLRACITGVTGQIRARKYDDT